MSSALVQQKIGKLQAFITKNPAFRNVPFAEVAGRATNPVQALSMLKSGRNVQEIITQLAELGVDPPEDYALAIARLQALAALPGPAPTVYAIDRPRGEVVGKGMTIQQQIREIEGRTPLGEQLVNSYRGLKVEMAKQMKRA